MHTRSFLGEHKNYISHDSMVESSDFEQLSYGMNSYSQFFSQFGVVPKFCLLLGKFERID